MTKNDIPKITNRTLIFTHFGEFW